MPGETNWTTGKGTRTRNWTRELEQGAGAGDWGKVLEPGSGKQGLGKHGNWTGELCQGAGKRELEDAAGNRT